MSGYYHYFHFGLSKYADRVLIRVRSEVCRIFIDVFRPTENDTILDIGVSDDEHVSANYLEKTYPHPGKIIALALQPHRLPGITMVCGDGRALPFADKSVDYVYSHAVIEHTGNRASQRRFLAEAYRVCRKGVLLTTPNRWHPIETHIGLPFLHYLPASVFRKFCRALGKTMYAQEATLNLLSASDLRALTVAHSAEFHNITWLGISSNLVLIIRK